MSKLHYKFDKIIKFCYNYNIEYRKEYIMKDLLTELYIDAIQDATSFYLSDYCTSDEEEKERLNEDKEKIDYFISILKQI